jgi:hypothetical protein
MEAGRAHKLVEQLARWFAWLVDSFQSSVGRYYKMIGYIIMRFLAAKKEINQKFLHIFSVKWKMSKKPKICLCSS